MGRRRAILLSAVAFGLALLAGCSGLPSDLPTPPRETGGPGPASSTPATGTPSPATASPSTGSGPAPRKVYLALGDSLTAGFQRATGDDKGGAYPALLAQRFARDGVPLAVENLACTGESTTDLVSGGRCQPPPNSQLSQAERIASGRAGEVALVTLLIGANDVLRCISSGAIDRTCLAEGEQVYGENLPEVMRRLRAAVGPAVPIAVLTYYDPFRQTIAGRNPSADFRQSSAEGTERLNAALSEAAAGVGAMVIDLRPLVEGSDGQALCTMTSVCTSGDFHFNATANAAVADLLHEALAPALRH